MVRLFGLLLVEVAMLVEDAMLAEDAVLLNWSTTV